MAIELLINHLLEQIVTFGADEDLPNRGEDLSEDSDSEEEDSDEEHSGEGEEEEEEEEEA